MRDESEREKETDMIPISTFHCLLLSSSTSLTLTPRLTAQQSALAGRHADDHDFEEESETSKDVKRRQAPSSDGDDDCKSRAAHTHTDSVARERCSRTLVCMAAGYGTFRVPLSSSLAEWSSQSPSSQAAVFTESVWSTAPNPATDDCTSDQLMVTLCKRRSLSLSLPFLSLALSLTNIQNRA